MKINHNYYLKLAFQRAKINLGKTKANPSVGCVVVKNDSVISSGETSISGRPHAEANALRFKKNFKKANLYSTMEPCTHYGLTPPCTNIIKKKGIKRVFYSFDDIDIRTASLAKKKLAKENIKVYKRKQKEFNFFYQSYFVSKKKLEPLIDAKLAISKDYYTINKKSKWITNDFSRKRVHLIRSEYDAIISTSKSINLDNSQLNCRLKDFNNNKPDLIIIDLDLKIKKRLKIFKNNRKRKIILITSYKNMKKKIYFNKLGVKLIFVKQLLNKNDFISLFKLLNKFGYNRLLIESGLVFLNTLLKFKLIFNMYIFKSSTKLFKNGLNNTTNYYIKKLKLNHRIKVNLRNDNLFKVKIKNV